MDSVLDKFYSIIPAGGVGSRLWPLSRANAPKFLHDLTGSGTSLLRDTWDRLVPLSGPDRIMVIIGNNHLAAVSEQLPELSRRNTVLEPEPRESTAAICLAAAILQRREPDVIVGSFAADHVIKMEHRFRRAVVSAVRAAAEGYIATIGILPKEPATQFGYIRCGEGANLAAAPEVLAVESFVEKPDHATAEQYLQSGNYLWNAGIFIARADVLLDQLAQSQPKIHRIIMEIADKWEDNRDAIQNHWSDIPRIAIDYAVAEPSAAAGKMVTVPGDFEWDDAGDFASIAKLNSRGGSDLVILGEHPRVLSDSATGIVVSQTERVISVIGAKDIVVIDTEDSLLVTTKDNAQKVKQIVEALKLSGRDDVL